jgi:hypothetical protein
MKNIEFIFILAVLNTIKYLLLPALGIAGLITGAMLPRLSLVQRHAVLFFWLSLLTLFLLIKVVHVAAGDYWARLTFAYAMGYLAFALRLLK